jgi:hypothetical protein
LTLIEVYVTDEIMPNNTLMEEEEYERRRR